MNSRLSFEVRVKPLVRKLDLFSLLNAPLGVTEIKNNTSKFMKRKC